MGEEGNIFLSRAPRSFSRARFARELANVFEKNEKKNKKTSVYRLQLSGHPVLSGHKARSRN